jgi:hypothetical protein
VASDWNALLERLLSVPLTANEYRLALAIARSTLGYRRRSERLGRRLLQEHSGISDGRGFDRARDGLVEAGLLRYTAGSVGRGNRSTYELLLDPEKGRSHAAKKPPEKRPLHNRKKAALARPRIGKRKEEATGPASPATANIQTKTADAYLAAGGSLELDEWRGALARQATALAKRGVAERTIVAAAGKLGRAREFPGYLRQRAEALEAAGGPCSWDGLDRSRLTAEQLAACSCSRCSEWRAFLAVPT